MWRRLEYYGRNRVTFRKVRRKWNFLTDRPADIYSHKMESSLNPNPKSLDYYRPKQQCSSATFVTRHFNSSKEKSDAPFKMLLFTFFRSFKIALSLKLRNLQLRKSWSVYVSSWRSKYTIWQISIKEKFTIEQAKKARGGSRGIALLFL